jgi:hypothetical protein
MKVTNSYRNVGRRVSTLTSAVPVLAAVAFTLQIATSSASPVARSAQTITVNERVVTHLTSHHGTSILNEQGQGSGTFKCFLTLQIKISYTNATISFLCNLSGGSMTGSGSTSFIVAGSISHFNGAITITHGTGRYSHASARSLHIQGILQRNSYSLSATVAGSMSI